MKVVSYERTDSHHRYVVSAKEGHSVELAYRRRRSAVSGQLQPDPGAILGYEAVQQVAAFREAADWLSRFLTHEGAPLPGLVQNLAPMAAEEAPAEGSSG